MSHACLFSSRRNRQIAQALRSFSMQCCRSFAVLQFYSDSCVCVTPVFLTFPVKKNRLAISSVSIPRIAPPELCVLMSFCGHPTLLVYLWLCAFCSGGAGTGAGGAALLLSAYQFGIAMLSAGSTLGLRAPDCAKEPLALWTLLTLRRVRLSQTQNIAKSRTPE